MSNKKNKSTEFANVKRILGHNGDNQPATVTEPTAARTDLPAPFLDTIDKIRRAEPKREELVSLMTGSTQPASIVTLVVSMSRLKEMRPASLQTASRSPPEWPAD